MSQDYSKYIFSIDSRIKELENDQKNQAIEILKCKVKFEKTLKTKYASRVMIAENKIHKIQRKIDKYKEVRIKYENKLRGENEINDDSITFAGGAI